MFPRNRAQVQNTIKRDRENRLLSNDDICGLNLLSDELGDFLVLRKLRYSTRPHLILEIVYESFNLQISSLSKEAQLFISPYSIIGKIWRPISVFFNSLKTHVNEITITDSEIAVTNAFRNILP